MVVKWARVITTLSSSNSPIVLQTNNDNNKPAVKVTAPVATGKTNSGMGKPSPSEKKGQQKPTVVKQDQASVPQKQQPANAVKKGGKQAGNHKGNRANMAANLINASKAKRYDELVDQQAALRYRAKVNEDKANVLKEKLDSEREARKKTEEEFKKYLPVCNKPVEGNEKIVMGPEITSYTPMLRKYWLYFLLVIFALIVIVDVYKILQDYVSTPVEDEETIRKRFVMLDEIDTMTSKVVTTQWLQGIWKSVAHSILKLLYLLFLKTVLYLIGYLFVFERSRAIALKGPNMTIGNVNPAFDNRHTLLSQGRCLRPDPVLWDATWETRYIFRTIFSHQYAFRLPIVPWIGFGKIMDGVISLTDFCEGTAPHITSMYNTEEVCRSRIDRHLKQFDAVNVPYWESLDNTTRYHTVSCFGYKQLDGTSMSIKNFTALALELYSSQQRYLRHSLN